MTTTSTKYDLRLPSGSDAPNAPTAFDNFTDDLEAVMAGFSTDVSRPAAGKAGRLHLQPAGGSGTPPTNTLSWDDGSVWRTLGVLDPTSGLIVPVLSGYATLTGYTETLVDLGNMGSSKTIDLSTGNEFKGTLNSPTCTVSFTNIPSGTSKRTSWTLRLIQDGSGSRQVTWPASVNWGSAGAPALTTTAAKSDLISFITDDGGTTVYAVYGGGGF